MPAIFSYELYPTSHSFLCKLIIFALSKKVRKPLISSFKLLIKNKKLIPANVIIQ